MKKEKQEQKLDQVIEKKPKNTKAILLMILAGILAIGMLVMWISNSSKYNKLEKSSNEKQKVLITKTEKIIKEKDMTSLKLLMKPLTWAVRAEMLRENMDQVNQYAYNMVKEKNFQIVIIISNTGKIISATDKKLEETQFESNFDKEFLTGNEVMSKSIDSNLIAISAPIMGYDNRLGTLFLTYTPEKYDLNILTNSTDSIQ
jgi:uncharacterized membrane protein YwzB